MDRLGDERLGLRTRTRTGPGTRSSARVRRAGPCRSHCVRPGPFHVGVLLENTPEFLFWLGGAAMTGATVVGINPTRRGKELEAESGTSTAS